MRRRYLTTNRSNSSSYVLEIYLMTDIELRVSLASVPTQQVGYAGIFGA